MTHASLSLASFFSIEARDYQSFTFDAAARETAVTIILGVCLMMILVSLYALYQKYVPGAIVRAILKAEAHSKETAKTAEELGLQKNPLALLELKLNLSLKKLVVLANDEEDAAPLPTPCENASSEATDADAPEEELARFYIPEDLKYRADDLFNKKGNTLGALLISTGLVAIFGILLIKLFPTILSIVDNILK